MSDILNIIHELANCYDNEKDQTVKNILEYFHKKGVHVKSNHILIKINDQPKPRGRPKKTFKVLIDTHEENENVQMRYVSNDEYNRVYKN
jgi:hypothetical protein|uniref:Uncharacterized protein n=1 Tax=viral metagenome TaxID=1070528 RepID=A0A6C0LK52_9ZZZZ